MRVIVQLVRRALQRDASGLEHIGEARKPERKLGILLDQHHRHAALDDIADDARRSPAP